MGNHAKRVNVRCALWMIRAVFTISDLGPRRLCVRRNVTVVSTVTGCDVTCCATTLQGFNKHQKRIGQKSIGQKRALSKEEKMTKTNGPKEGLAKRGQWPREENSGQKRASGQKRNWPKEGIGQKSKKLAKTRIGQKRAVHWPKEALAKKIGKSALAKRGHWQKIGQKRNLPSQFQRVTVQKGSNWALLPKVRTWGQCAFEQTENWPRKRKTLAKRGRFAQPCFAFQRVSLSRTVWHACNCWHPCQCCFHQQGKCKLGSQCAFEHTEKAGANQGNERLLW